MNSLYSSPLYTYTYHITSREIYIRLRAILKESALCAAILSHYGHTLCFHIAHELYVQCTHSMHLLKRIFSIETTFIVYIVFDTHLLSERVVLCYQIEFCIYIPLPFKTKTFSTCSLDQCSNILLYIIYFRGCIYIQYTQSQCAGKLSSPHTCIVFVA